MKRNLFYLTILLTICSSCVKKEVVRNNRALNYVNYAYGDTMPFNFHNYNTLCQSDTFDSGFRTKTVLVTPQESNIPDNLYSDFISADGCFDSTARQNDLTRKTNISSAHTIYYGGKISLNQHVDSYLFVFIDKLNTTDPFYNSSIILVNLKINKICSVVELARFNNSTAEHKNLVTTIKQGNSLLGTNYIHATEYYLFKQSQRINYDRFPPLENKTVYNIKESFRQIKTKLMKEKKLYYTLFYIDDNGFVKFQNKNKEEINTLEKTLRSNNLW